MSYVIHIAALGISASQQLRHVIRASYSAHLRHGILLRGSLEVPMAGDIEPKVDFRENDDTYKTGTR